MEKGPDIQGEMMEEFGGLGTILILQKSSTVLLCATLYCRAMQLLLEHMHSRLSSCISRIIIRTCILD